jgi:hypothetical protein
MGEEDSGGIDEQALIDAFNQGIPALRLGLGRVDASAVDLVVVYPRGDDREIGRADWAPRSSWPSLHEHLMRPPEGIGRTAVDSARKYDRPRERWMRENERRKKVRQERMAEVESEPPGDLSPPAEMVESAREVHELRVRSETGPGCPCITCRVNRNPAALPLQTDREWRAYMRCAAIAKASSGRDWEALVLRHASELLDFLHEVDLYMLSGVTRRCNEITRPIRATSTQGAWILDELRYFELLEECAFFEAPDPRCGFELYQAENEILREMDQEYEDRRRWMDDESDGYARSFESGYDSDNHYILADENRHRASDTWIIGQRRKCEREERLRLMDRRDATDPDWCHKCSDLRRWCLLKHPKYVQSSPRGVTGL